MHDALHQLENRFPAGQQGRRRRCRVVSARAGSARRGARRDEAQARAAPTRAARRRAACRATTRHVAPWRRSERRATAAARGFAVSRRVPRVPAARQAQPRPATGSTAPRPLWCRNTAGAGAPVHGALALQKRDTKYPAHLPKPTSRAARPRRVRERCSLPGRASHVQVGLT